MRFLPQFTILRSLRCVSAALLRSSIAFVSIVSTLVAASAFAEWSSFVDGNVYHASPGGSERADALKLDPIAAAGATVWAGSSGGLTGFDSVARTPTRLYRNDGLPSQDISAVGVDDGGNLWIGTRSHGLTARAADGTFLKRPLDALDFGSDSVRVIVTVGPAVWVGTALGAARLSFPDDPDLPGTAVEEVLNLTSLLDASPYVNAIVPDGDSVWFGTRRGVVRRDVGGFDFFNDGLDGDAIDVHALAMLSGSLWCATVGGVYRLEGTTWVRRDTGVDPALEPRALVVFDDTLYLGVRAGASVYRLDATALSWTADSTGLAGRIVAGLAEAGGRLYAATHRGLWERGTSGIWVRIPSVDPPAPEALFNNFDYVDIFAAQGEAWAVTRNFVNHYDGAWEAVRAGESGLDDSDMSRIIVDGGGLYVGHCCCEDPAGCPTDFLPASASVATPQPIDNIFGRAANPGDGSVWFGSVRAGEEEGQGLYRFDPASEEVTRYTTSGAGGSVRLPTLSSVAIQALAFDSLGRLWVGHQLEGIDVWGVPGNVASPLFQVTLLSGLPSDRVNAIATSGDGAWIGTSSGLAFVNRDLNVTRALGPEHGLPDPNVRSVAVDGCGRVWAATASGVAVFRPDGSLEAVFDEGTTPGPVDARVNAVSADIGDRSLWFATRNGVSRFEYAADCSSVAPMPDGPTPGPGQVSSSCQSFCPFPNPLRLDRGASQVFLADAPVAVSVRVFDAAGREVWASAGRVQPDGAVWNGTDRNGAPVPSGLYVLSIDTGGATRANRTLAIVR